jgi:protein TonB
LLCSFFPRNFFLISGVAIAHLLLLLGLLSAPIGGEEPSIQNSLMVSLMSMRKNSPSPPKSTTTTQKSPLSDSGSQSLMQANEGHSLTGAEGNRLASGGAREPVYSPKPHYPLASRRLREQGLVVVKLCVNEQGMVGEAEVSKSSGFKNLDQSALKALSQWRFTSITSNSANFFAQCFQTPVQFTLEG